VSPNKTTAKNGEPLYLRLISNRSMNSYFPKAVELRRVVSWQIFEQNSMQQVFKRKRNCAFIDAMKENTASVAVFATQNAHYGHVQMLEKHLNITFDRGTTKKVIFIGHASQ